MGTVNYMNKPAPEFTQIRANTIDYYIWRLYPLYGYEN